MRTATRAYDVAHDGSGAACKCQSYRHLYHRLRHLVVRHRFHVISLKGINIISSIRSLAFPFSPFTTSHTTLLLYHIMGWFGSDDNSDQAQQYNDVSLSFHSIHIAHLMITVQCNSSSSHRLPRVDKWGCRL